MKQRILLIVAMLLVTVPAFAAVTINVTKGTGDDANKLTVAYTATGGDKVRAFALDFTFTTYGAEPYKLTFSNIADFNRGESNKPGGGYGIFPGQFRNVINPADPNWLNQYYYPAAPPNDVDSNGTGMGQSKFIAELGTLYKDSNAPGTSGTLFTVRIDANGPTQCSNLAVTVNTVRGGVVLEDGTSVPSPTINTPSNPVCLAVCPDPPATLTYPAADGNNGRYQVTWSAAPDAEGYELERSADAGSTWIPLGSSSPFCDDVNTGSYRYRVRSTKSGCSPSAWNTGSTDCVVVLCFPTSEPNMQTWKNLGKPRCWCYARQCKGDGDGTLATGGSTKVGYWYVGSADVTAFTKAYLIKEPTFGPGLKGEPNICYDVDHTYAAGGSTKVGYWRVGSADVTLFTKQYLIKEPTFGSGIGTCPAGASGSRFTLPTDPKPCN